MSTKELLDEINYLTSLIQSHKKSSLQANSHHSSRRNKRVQEKYKWTGSSTGSAISGDSTSSQSSSASRTNYSKQLQHRERTKHGNLVYKPDNQSRPPQSHTKLTNKIDHSPLTTHMHETVDGSKSQVPSTSAQSPSTSTRKRKRSLSRNVDYSTPSRKHKKTLPSRSQLKWKSIEGSNSHTAAKTSKSSTLDQTDASTDAPVQNQPYKTLALKRPLTPANSRYKWRRRLSSSSKKVRSRLSSSSLVAQSNYKLTRASLLRKSPKSPFYRRPGSFARRLRRTSLHVHTSKKHTSRTPVRTTKYKNKVWFASSAEPSDQDTATDSDATLGSTRLAGHESKTRRGNKQWVASNRQTTSRTTNIRTRHSLRKQNGVTVISLRDSKFTVDASGRKLRRLLSSSELVQTHLLHSPGIRKGPSFTRVLASQAVRRSKVYVWQAKQRSKQQDKSKQYCMFYNRFGKCKHMNTTCPYIHDADKIAVCTKFLKGVCDRVNGTCPFSHKLSKEKMPVCSFFLRGVCSRDNCPYLHVSVGRDADVCTEFAKGYCPRGDQCTKQHTLDCPEYLRNGSCSKGKACPLRHSKRAHRPKRVLIKRKAEKDSGPLEEPRAFRRIRKWKEYTCSISAGRSADHSDSVGATGELEFIPLEPKQTLDFIAL